MNKLVLLAIILFSSLCFFGCSDDPTSPENENSIEVNFPINKKAVYAIGEYRQEPTDSTYIFFLLNIYSLEIKEVSETPNGREYIGEVIQYCMLKDNSGEFIHDPVQCTDEGDFFISEFDDWILFQFTDLRGSEQILLKSNPEKVDTMLLPSRNKAQLPVLPRTIQPNSNYSSYRPANPDSFGAVQRDFAVGDYMDWNDTYGSERGLYCKTNHILVIDTPPLVSFSSIIDKRGIITSSMSGEYYSYQNDLLIDSLTIKFKILIEESKISQIQKM